MAAPDFYFAINATFRWIYDNWGEAGLLGYWEAMGCEHFAGVTQSIRDWGLPALHDYWQEFFDNEPGAEVDVELSNNVLVVDVKTCPAIKHLQTHDREMMPFYCQHCTVVSQALCEPAGIRLEVEGGQGRCRQIFREGSSHDRLR